jgi:hypothetical protein
MGGVHRTEALCEKLSQLCRAKVGALIVHDSDDFSRDCAGKSISAEGASVGARDKAIHYGGFTNER